MSRADKDKVMTGRRTRCPSCRSERHCLSCQMRMKYGPPNPNAHWDALKLDERQVSWLLIAAAEFMALHREYEAEQGEKIPVDVVEFVDWLTPEVTGPVAPYTIEGSLKRNESTRHPDELPYFPRRGAA